MNMKLFWGLNTRLTTLLDEHVEIYFRERPWIDKPVKKEKVRGQEITILDDSPHIMINLQKEREQNELETKKVVERLLKLLEPEKKETVSDATIEMLFGSQPTS